MKQKILMSYIWVKKKTFCIIFIKYVCYKLFLTQNSLEVFLAPICLNMNLQIINKIKKIKTQNRLLYVTVYVSFKWKQFKLSSISVRSDHERIIYVFNVELRLSIKKQPHDMSSVLELNSQLKHTLWVFVENKRIDISFEQILYELEGLSVFADCIE